jgi:integrase/recombinase XerD
LSIQPLPHQRPPRYLTQEEIGRFFGVIHDLRDRALFALMYHHGLRVGEVLLLRRIDLDLERGRLLVRRLKGGAWSEQILFAGSAAILRDYLARLPGGPEDPLFAGRHGSLKRRQIQMRFVRYRTLARLPERRTTHSLRHSIATHLLDAGVSLEFVQDHLGHQNIRSTSIYARITDRHRAALFQQLERSPWIVHPGTAPSGSAPADPSASSPAPEEVLRT